MEGEPVQYESHALSESGDAFIDPSLKMLPQVCEHLSVLIHSHRRYMQHTDISSGLAELGSFLHILSRKNIPGLSARA